MLKSIEGNAAYRPPCTLHLAFRARPSSTTSDARQSLVVIDGWSGSALGTAKSKGTVFALAGKVNNTGLVEVPMERPCAR